MSNEIKAPISSVFDLVSGIQRAVMYLTLFLIPWFVIPLPYDSTEKIKGILFIFLSTILLLLEVVKWIWDGKITILKSPLDKIFLLLFGSFLLSFAFAQDTWISLWGYDGRIGGGFLVMTFLFLFFFLLRGVLQQSKEVVRAIEALLLGLGVLILLSMFSIFKVNVFGWIPYIKDFFIVGLPLTFSFQEIMLITGISSLLSVFLIIYYAINKKYQLTILPILILVISLVSMPLFSINQGALVPILFFVITLLLCILLILRLEKSLKAIPILLFLFSVLAVGFSIGFQFEGFRASVLGDSFEMINPIRLGSDISWTVASASIVSTFFRGLVGLGNDSFAIAYHAFRPASDATISLGNTSFVSGSNEIFTTLANRGFVGVTVWILLGLTLLRELLKDITDGSAQKSILSSILGLGILLILLGSIFLPFSFLTYFLLFVTVMLLIIYRNREGESDVFLLKFWAVNVGKATKDINKTIEGVNWFFTILITLITTVGIIFLATKLLSVAYVVRAESYNTQQIEKYKEYKEQLSIEEREEYLVSMTRYYNSALRYDLKDPYVNRRSALISIDLISILSEKSTDASDQEKEAILSEVSIWKNSAIDLSKQAITTSPLTYANWNTRANVYLSLISLGYTDYSEDALNSLQNCVNINPLDYDAYYKAAQIFMIKEDYNKALNSFTKVLSINGQHIPSLVLAANILNEKGETENAITYLDAAKQIMELNKQDSGELYESIVNGLEQLGANTKEIESELEDEQDFIQDDEVINEKSS